MGRVVTAPGFCTCKRDFPGRLSFHPPEHATWHYLCDKPVLPPAEAVAEPWSPFGEALQVGIGQAREKYRPTGTGWPAEDAESQRIAEVFDDARAELDRGL